MEETDEKGIYYFNISGIPVMLWSQNLGTPLTTPLTYAYQWSVSGVYYFCRHVRIRILLLA